MKTSVFIFSLLLVAVLATNTLEPDKYPAQSWSFGDSSDDSTTSSIVGILYAVFYLAVVFLATFVVFIVLIGIFLLEILLIICLILSLRGQYTRKTMIPFGIVLMIIAPFLSNIGFIVFVIGIVLLGLGIPQRKANKKAASQMLTGQNPLNPYYAAPRLGAPPQAFATMYGNPQMMQNPAPYQPSMMQAPVMQYQPYSGAGIGGSHGSR
ncbi:hypothetical protein J8273_7803 [Carpediemonas membranifera]|uniref:Uncharacterized protein n=1 Tax=Carpediemonas membranifera TaxID=201153 RepID=A0A8J6B0L6_9EUKA|nr:hypothetical protein J8273_7803 [Carpediemonas membranifera]|eukprot:KAG9390452.1 hypothetical protein J8273_7803 [Carpediemonas membranifera]